MVHTTKENGPAGGLHDLNISPRTRMRLQPKPTKYPRPLYLEGEGFCFTRGCSPLPFPQPPQQYTYNVSRWGFQAGSQHPGEEPWNLFCLVCLERFAVLGNQELHLGGLGIGRWGAFASPPAIRVCPVRKHTLSHHNNQQTNRRVPQGPPHTSQQLVPSLFQPCFPAPPAPEASL
jgi:hypothetical protein